MIKMYCERCKSMQETRGKSHDAWLNGEGFRCLNCDRNSMKGKIPSDFADDETRLDGEWLNAMGFKLDITPKRCSATIVVDDYGKTCSKARVELRLMLIPKDDEWTTDLFSYDEEGAEQNCMGLPGSWCKTRADVVRLGIALIEDWRE